MFSGEKCAESFCLGGDFVDGFNCVLGCGVGDNGILVFCVFLFFPFFMQVGIAVVTVYVVEEVASVFISEDGSGFLEGGDFGVAVFKDVFPCVDGFFVGERRIFDIVQDDDAGVAEKGGEVVAFEDSRLGEFGVDAGDVGDGFLVEVDVWCDVSEVMVVVLKDFRAVEDIGGAVGDVSEFREVEVLRFGAVGCGNRWVEYVFGILWAKVHP